jgi:hypothetical protein
MSDDTHITTIIQGEYLYVNVSGMAYSIAERGEQLAWLACVLRPLRFSGPNPVLVYTSPSIKSLSQSPHETVPDSISTRQNPDSIRKAKEDDVHVHNGTGNEKPLSPIREWHRHGLVQRAFTIEISEEIVPYTAQEGPLWYILLQPPIVPIIARGFPTARRPEPRPGLEIPFHILCRSIGASNSIIRHGHILLNGNLINLVASEKMGDVCFWQPSESSPNSDARAVYEDGRFLHERKSYGLSSSEIGELDLEKCRHVVCCWAGNQSSEINDCRPRPLWSVV